MVFKVSCTFLVLFFFNGLMYLTLRPNIRSFVGFYFGWGAVQIGGRLGYFESSEKIEYQSDMERILEMAQG